MFENSIKYVWRTFLKKFQGCFKNVSMKFCFVIFLLHGSHRSYPSRGRACLILSNYSQFQPPKYHQWQRVQQWPVPAWLFQLWWRSSCPTRGWWWWSWRRCSWPQSTGRRPFILGEGLNIKKFTFYLALSTHGKGFLYSGHF